MYFEGQKDRERHIFPSHGRTMYIRRALVQGVFNFGKVPVTIWAIVKKCLCIYGNFFFCISVTIYIIIISNIITHIGYVGLSYGTDLLSSC